MEEENCPHESCEAVWVPGPWNEVRCREERPPIWYSFFLSQCEDSCVGNSGVQRRDVYCRWKGTALSAGHECDPDMKPAVERMCASCFGKFLYLVYSLLFWHSKFQMALVLEYVPTNRVIAVWLEVWRCADSRFTSQNAVPVVPKIPSPAALVLHRHQQTCRLEPKRMR